MEFPSISRARRRWKPGYGSACLLSLVGVCLTVFSGASHPGVAVQGAPERHDLVLLGGRVMDPESGLDSILNVAVSGGRIVAVTGQRLEGIREIDAGGLIVAPGFIDLHAHGQDPFSRDLQALDGVTTALDMEGGAGDVAGWYEDQGPATRINVGVAASYGAARSAVLGPRREEVVYGAASAAEQRSIQRVVRQQIRDGALGVGLGLQYLPGASREEIYRLFETTTDAGATVFSHVRYGSLLEPESSMAAVQEMIASAAGSGGSVHIVHIASSGLARVPILLDMIDGARAAGVDVTTEVYPYQAASTDIRAAIFDPGWRERLGAGYPDIEWVATGERLDSLGFLARRAEGGQIIAHIIPGEAVAAAVAYPGVIIASDGVGYVDGRAHPRGAGTYARVLGRFVREEGELTLMDALRKMTLLPARRLEDFVPAFRAKGRVSVGADADVTVFDPDTVRDRATFPDPALPSEGIRWVLVNGEPVVADGRLVDGARPGRPIRRVPK